MMARLVSKVSKGLPNIRRHGYGEGMLGYVAADMISEVFTPAIIDFETILGT